MKELNRGVSSLMNSRYLTQKLSSRASTICEKPTSAEAQLFPRCEYHTVYFGVKLNRRDI